VTWVCAACATSNAVTASTCVACGAAATTGRRHTDHREVEQIRLDGPYGHTTLR